jgi:hypothetical protein
MGAAIGYGSTPIAMLIDEGGEGIVHGDEHLGACHGIVVGVDPTWYLKDSTQSVDALFAPVSDIAIGLGI